ncbi:MAG: EamA family transporter [Nitriliruptoraceae bacterium]
MTRLAGELSERAAAGAVLAGAVLWGTVGAAQELGAANAQPFTVAAVRSVGAAIALPALLLSMGRGRALLTALVAAPGRMLASGLSIAVFQVALLTGIRGAGVALGTLLAIGSSPAWAGGFAVVTGHPPGRRWLVSTVLTMVGAAVLLLLGTDGGSAHEAGATPTMSGVVASLVAGAAYATYATLAKRILELGATGPGLVAVVFVVAGLALAPLLAVGDSGWVASQPGGVTAVWLTLTTAGGYLLFARGLRRLDAPKVTTLTLAEPLTATVLALVVVGERLTGAGLVGALLLLAGLVLVSTRSAAMPDRHRGA